MAAHTEKFLLTTDAAEGRDMLIAVSRILCVTARRVEASPGRVEEHSDILIEAPDITRRLQSPDSVSTILRKIHNAQRRNQYAHVKKI